jgi:two-component system, OmpR family, KDP operon response regulator KdpE
VNEGPLVLIVEDDHQVCRFLHTSLIAHAYRTLECSTGERALELVRERSPDVVLLDLNLPDLDGMEIVARIRSWTMLPIIVISARALERQKVEALDAGADDYLTKPFGFEELLARIRTALRHASRAKQPSHIFSSGPLLVDLMQHRVMLDGEQVRLTTIEFKLLAALVEHAGKVVTHRQLLDQVWGTDQCDQIQYLRVYMGHLRRKMEPDPLRPRLFLTEAGIGYRLRVDDAEQG